MEHHTDHKMHDHHHMTNADENKSKNQTGKEMRNNLRLEISATGFIAALPVNYIMIKKGVRHQH